MTPDPTSRRRGAPNQAAEQSLEALVGALAEAFDRTYAGDDRGRRLASLAELLGRLDSATLYDMAYGLGVLEEDENVPAPEER